MNIRSPLSLSLTFLAIACGELSLEDKTACEVDNDCLTGNRCRLGRCTADLEDDAGAGMPDAGDTSPIAQDGGEPEADASTDADPTSDGDADASTSSADAGPVDRTPPGALGLDPAEGVYGLADAFDCVRVLGIEDGGSARYAFNTLSAPKPPGANAALVSAQEPLICGLAQNGTSYLALIPVDAAGNTGPLTRARYDIDTTPPDAPLAPPSGPYNALTVGGVFDVVGAMLCAPLGSGSNQSTVYFEATHDGTPPPEPTPGTSPTLDVLGLACPVASAGVSDLAVLEIDAAGNASPVARYSYDIDLEPFTIDLTPSGSFDAQGAFSCVSVTGIEPDGIVHYTLLEGDGTPAAPTQSSPSLTSGANQICDLDQDGRTQLRLIPVDRAGNVGPTVSRDYTIDAVPPVVTAFTHDAIDGRSYLHHTLHLRVAVQDTRPASATVAIGSLQLTLLDTGTGGDEVPGDGVFELDYVVEPGVDVAGAPTTTVTDAVGNTGSSSLPDVLDIDAVGTSAGGAVYATNTSWDAAGAPYIIDADVYVSAGAVLTVGANVGLSFTPAGRFVIAGELHVMGDSDDPVLVNDGMILVQDLRAGPSFDDQGNYVQGTRLEGLHMPDGVVLLSTPWNGGALYLRDSSVRQISSSLISGLYAERCSIGRLGQTLSGVFSLRLLDSYVGMASLAGQTPIAPGVRVEGCRFDSLTLSSWPATATLTRSEIDYLHIYAVDTPLTLQGNNLGMRGADPIVEVTHSSGQSVHDLQANHWGPDATPQMQAQGEDADINAIVDFRDFADQDRVDYAGFLLAPVADAGPSW